MDRDDAATLTGVSGDGIRHLLEDPAVGFVGCR
jgi:hypothetical protein